MVLKERKLLCDSKVFISTITRSDRDAEHDDPQVMVLASLCCFRRDLSFLFSLRNTLIQLVVNRSVMFQFIK